MFGTSQHTALHVSHGAHMFGRARLRPLAACYRPQRLPSGVLPRGTLTAAMNPFTDISVRCISLAIPRSIRSGPQYATVG
jgi:hypothetical protein